MYINEGEWFKCNERTSEQWLSLNKTRIASTVIKALLRTDTQKETEDPTELLKNNKEIPCTTTERIAIREDRKRAINAI